MTKLMQEGNQHEKKTGQPRCNVKPQQQQLKNTRRDQLSDALPPDYVNYEADDAFWIDLYAEILNGYHVICSLGTHAVSPPKKRFSSKDVPLVFGTDERVDKFKEYISLHNPNWQWCERVTTIGVYGKDYPYKVFYVYADSVDSKLVEINYNEDEPETWFYGYSPEQNIPPIAKYADLPLAQQPAAAITTVEGEAFIIPEYYSEDQLVQRVKAVAERHNKTFVLNL